MWDAKKLIILYTHYKNYNLILILVDSTSYSVQRSSVPINFESLLKESGDVKIRVSRSKDFFLLLKLANFNFRYIKIYKIILKYMQMKIFWLWLLQDYVKAKYMD